MSRLDDLDAAIGGPMRFILGGQAYELASPDRMPWQHVMACLDLGFTPLTNTSDDALLTLRQAKAVFQAWRRHYDLPTIDQARRLAYLVDRYHDDLAYELRRIQRLDLDEEWRARRWRRLLELTDRLPRNTHFAAAVGNDLEHAEMLAQAMAERGDQDGDEASTGPAIQDWSPELEKMTELGDQLDRLIYYTMAAANVKNPPKPEPAPRPITAVARAMRSANRQRRQAAHDSLTQRLLPHKRKRAE